MITPQQAFGREKVFLPVVHVVSIDQAIENVAIAKENGAPGVFMINHDVSPHILQDAHQLAKVRFPGYWIGLNFLRMAPGIALNLAMEGKAGGLWTDNAGLDESFADPAADARTDWQVFLDAREYEVWDGLYFGGVAFKYQGAVHDLDRISKSACEVMDVVTTSGTGTGSAPDMGKIRRMRKAIGSHPMAIASGITPENIAEFLPLCDYFLVATGISVSHIQLDPKKVRQLADAIDAYKP